MTLFIDPELNLPLERDKPLFDELMSLEGKTFRQHKNRITQKVTISGVEFFIKKHHPIGRKEIIKNTLNGRKTITSARHEWFALGYLHHYGIRVPKVFAFGERGRKKHQQESFILLEAIQHKHSLETLCTDWKNNPPNLPLKRILIREVGRIARIMHQHHMTHRDFYLCHFLYEKSQSKQNGFELALIDLHRATVFKKLPTRWRIKDLSSLYFSAMDIGLSNIDKLRFLRYYFDKPLPVIMKQHKRLLQKVEQKANRLYISHT